MKVVIEPSQELIIIAVAHELKYGDYISVSKATKKWIKKAVEVYIISFGELCIDDHKTELERETEAANKILKRFKL